MRVIELDSLMGKALDKLRSQSLLLLNEVHRLIDQVDYRHNYFAESL